MSKLNLKITTAESEVFSGEVESITLPASEGEITILPSHVKIISSISSGELRLKITSLEQKIVDMKKEEKEMLNYQ